MANIGATFSMIAISVIFIVAIIGVFQIQSFQSNYNAAFKDIVDQLNTVQQKEVDFDRRSKQRVNTIVNDASQFNSSFVTNDAVAKGVNSQSLNVYGSLKADKNSVQANDIVFSSRWSGYPNQQPNQAFIANDTELNKKLMIVGNKSDGSGERKVGVWDKLDVHGNMGIDKVSSAHSVIAKERIGGEGVYMDKDGNIYSSLLIEGESIQGRDAISVGNGAAYMRKDGNVYANKNLVSESTIDGQNIVGTNMVKVSNNAAWMKNDGTFSGKQVCLGGTCINKTELQKIKSMSSPSDCVVSNWTPWSLCSKPCGSGSQYRIRNVLKNAANGGQVCPALIENQDCNKQACGTDCVVSNWSAWTTCTRTCGGGSRSRTRSVVSQPQNGGVACPELQQFEVCNQQECVGPQPCLLSDWSDFGTCNKVCGGGTMTRTRYVLQPAMNGAPACEPTSQDVPCNTQACAQDCVLGEWSAWRLFDYGAGKWCGNGTRTRTQAILTPAGPGGVACPTEVQRTQTQTTSVPACDTMFNPVLWFKIQDVDIENTPNGSIISRWTSSFNQKVATGYGVGGSLGPIFIKNEVNSPPYIRLGNGLATTTVGDFFDCGSQAFNMTSTGGFTFIGRVRFYGPVAANERIFDFGKGNNTIGNDNCLMARSGATNTWNLNCYNGQTNAAQRNAVDALTNFAWLTVAMRVTSTQIQYVVLNGTTLSATLTPIAGTTTAVTSNPLTQTASRTFAATYFGKSHWTTDSYANIDLQELAFYDRALLDTELITAFNTINASCTTAICSRMPYYLMDNEYYLGVLNNTVIINMPKVYIFDFTGSRWNAIRIQLFGAGGGLSTGGDGGYMEGILDLNKLPSRRFFIVVGGGGTSAVTNTGGIFYTDTAFNGGGRGVAVSQSSTLIGGGGGSTDVRLTYTSGSETVYSTANRILIAGGGGGGSLNTAGAAGGYPSGVASSTSATGGSQIANGNFSASGRAQGLGGENTSIITGMTSGNGGGGGGFWGGGAHPGTGAGGSGAGGSSFANAAYFTTIKYGPNGSTAFSTTQVGGGGSMAGRNGQAILTFIN